MACQYRCKHRVEFSDTDMAGIVHFSNLFRYMEIAEHEFLRALGLSVHARIDGRVVSWPRLRAECAYHAPARFEDELEIALIVREKRTKSIIYDFIISKTDGSELAHGSITVVCTTVDPVSGKLSSIPIPASFDEKIEAAPAELRQSYVGSRKC